MVQTRSGKSTSLMFKSKAHAVTSVNLFCENDMESHSLNRDADENRNFRDFKCGKRTLDERREFVGKKSRVLSDTTIATLNKSDSVAPQKDLKKVFISVEEKLMNGAPEGELYDVIVLEDHQLLPLASEATATEELLKVLQLFSSAGALWAEKFEAIVMLRRILYHHANAIRSGVHLLAMIDCISDQILSLRSSNVRNALMCVKLTAKVLDQDLWSQETALKLFTALLNKCGSGPKFLCDAAFECCRSTSNSCPMPLFLTVVQPFIVHKNSEISARAIETLVQKILNCDSSVLIVHNSSLRLLLASLALGLNAKKSQAKDKTKEALEFMRKTMGSLVFDEFIDENLEPSVGNDIKRELTKVTTHGLQSHRYLPSFPKPAPFPTKDLKSTNLLAAPTQRKPWEKSPIIVVAPTTVNDTEGISIEDLKGLEDIF